MSKDKKYTWKTSGRNGRYINKDIPGKKYKSLKYKYKQITTAGVGIILGKSLALNNYCYIDSVEDLYKAKHKIKYDREEIDRMYKILSHRYGEIISKELAFRRMKEKSSMLNSVMKSLSNQTKFSFTHIKLDAPEKAYLYAMIYPSIFEVNYMYSKDFMYERNPMFLKLCCEMLEEAILLTGYVPQKQGYIFKGWYEDVRTKESGMTEYTFNGNGVLYAKWEADSAVEQPDTLLTTDVAYLTDEEYALRVERIKSIIDKFIERYINSIMGASQDAPINMSWRFTYGK